MICFGQWVIISDICVLLRSISVLRERLKSPSEKIPMSCLLLLTISVQPMRLLFISIIALASVQFALTVGMPSFVLMKSLACLLSRTPSDPAGWFCEKSLAVNALSLDSDMAIVSQKIKEQVVELDGAKPRWHDSFTLGRVR